MREVLEEPIEQKTIFSEYNEKFPSWNFQIEYLCYWLVDMSRENIKHPSLRKN